MPPTRRSISSSRKGSRTSAPTWSSCAHRAVRWWRSSRPARVRPRRRWRRCARAPTSSTRPVWPKAPGSAMPISWCASIPPTSRAPWGRGGTTSPTPSWPAGSRSRRCCRWPRTRSRSPRRRAWRRSGSSSSRETRSSTPGRRATWRPTRGGSPTACSSRWPRARRPRRCRIRIAGNAVGPVTASGCGSRPTMSAGSPGCTGIAGRRCAGPGSARSPSWPASSRPSWRGCSRRVPRAGSPSRPGSSWRSGSAARPCTTCSTRTRVSGWGCCRRRIRTTSTSTSRATRGPEAGAAWSTSPGCSTARSAS